MVEKITPPNRFLVTVAWIIILSASMLPNILLHELLGATPAWLPHAKIALLGGLAVLAWLWKRLRPLRDFTLIIFSVMAIDLLVFYLTDSALWRGWFGGVRASFVQSMMGIQLGRMIVSLLVILVLLGLGYRRRDFFLVRGRLDAPITPVPWMGFPKADPWTSFGGQFSIYIGLGLLIFLVLGGRPSLVSIPLALPMLPAVLLFAAMNAFSEEMTYRASLLAGLEGVVGPRHALWITALFFGIGHYFGVPYGIVGVLMATFLGWMLGKAMLETRGFFWAWFIHFVQDVLIFLFMAVGAVTPGG